MSATVKPKTFGPVFAFSDGPDTTRYAYDEVSAPVQYPPDGTPVDTLLASLANCIVKSLIWAAKDQGMPLGAFNVKVTGVKAPDLPSRIGVVEILIKADLGADSALAQRIVALAKSVCTVSNTLNCAITVTHA